MRCVPCHEQTFGETAISLLDGRFDARARSALDARGGPACDEDFEACFLHAGGRQVLEELETLGSDCGRMVTRLRARLEPEAQAALDSAAAALSHAFDLQARADKLCCTALLQAFRSGRRSDQALKTLAAFCRLGSALLTVTCTCGGMSAMTITFVPRIQLPVLASRWEEGSFGCAGRWDCAWRGAAC